MSKLLFSYDLSYNKTLERVIKCTTDNAYFIPLTNKDELCILQILG